MLRRLGRADIDLRDGNKMFRFVLFTRRPLAVDELLHALAISDDPDPEFALSDDEFEKRLPHQRANHSLRR